MPTIEHQIEINRETRNPNSAVWIDFPSTSRIIIYVDVSKYNNPVFSWEALLLGGTPQPNFTYARLFNITDNVPVAGSEISTSNIVWTLVKSGSITLSGAKEYKVQVKQDVASFEGYMWVGSVMVIVNATPITVIENQIGIVALPSSTTSNVFVEVFFPSAHLHNADKYGGTIAIYFEVSGMVQKKTGEYQLYNKTDGLVVVTLSTTSTVPVRIRSGVITLSDNKEYTVRYRNTTSGWLVYCTGAKIIIQQSVSITKTRIMRAVAEYSSLVDESRVFLQDFTYDVSNFSGWSRLFTYESVFKTTDALYTAYSALRNKTDGIDVVGSQLSTNSITVVRLRSGTITLIDGKTYATRAWISQKTVMVHTSRVIIDLSLVTLVEVTDSFGMTDSVLRDKAINILDSFGLSDTVLRNKSLIIPDSIGLTDTILINKNLTVSDSIGLTDVIMVDKTLLIIDSFGLSETIEVIKLVAKIFSYSFPIHYIKFFVHVKRNGKIVHYCTPYTPFGVERAIQP